MKHSAQTFVIVINFVHISLARCDYFSEEIGTSHDVNTKENSGTYIQNSEHSFTNYFHESNLGYDNNKERDNSRTVTEKTSKLHNGKVRLRTSGGLDINRRFFSGAIEKFKEHIRLIVPGTKWCGDGDIATSEAQLGLFRKTDSCCREHDNCDLFIPARTAAYGLENRGLFTRSHCDCDGRFYNCLKNVGSPVSYQIGFTYFNVLRPHCFKAVPCIERENCYRRGRYENGEAYAWFRSHRY